MRMTAAAADHRQPESEHHKPGAPHTPPIHLHMVGSASVSSKVQNQRMSPKKTARRRPTGVRLA